MYKDIIPLISYIKSKGFRVLIITNGLLLKQYADDLIRLDVDKVIVSIDGPKQVNESIRGVGSYDKAVAGIITLLEARKRARTSHTLVNINTVIIEDSYKSLVELVEISKKLGIDEINFVYGWNIPSNMGYRYSQIFKRDFGIEANSWKGFEKNFSDITINMDELKSIVKNIAKMQNDKFKISFLPDLNVGDIESFYKADKKYLPKKCFSLWNRADIRYNGDMIFCGDYPDYVVGNLKNNLFKSIWNGKKARIFRKKIKEIGTLPICCRCCNLYQSDVYKNKKVKK